MSPPPAPALARPGETDSAEARAREADLIHRVLFGAAAPDDLKRLYAAALAAEPPNAQIAALFAAGADLEAVEFALRRKNPENALTRRFRALTYLAEARAEYFDRFVTERRRFWSGAAALAAAALCAAYLAVKGAYLARRYGLG